MGRIGGIFGYIGIMDDMLDTKEDFRWLRRSLDRLMKAVAGMSSFNIMAVVTVRLLAQFIGHLDCTRAYTPLVPGK